MENKMKLEGFPTFITMKTKGAFVAAFDCTQAKGMGLPMPRAM